MGHRKIGLGEAVAILKETSKAFGFCSYLPEVAPTNWEDSGRFPYGSEWMARNIKEIIDEVEGRLAQKVYSVSSKAMNRNKQAGMLMGTMKGVGPFSIVVSLSVKSGSKTGAHKTDVTVSAGEGGSPSNKVFSNTASVSTIVKWVMQQLNSKRY